MRSIIFIISGIYHQSPPHSFQHTPHSSPHSRKLSFSHWHLYLYPRILTLIIQIRFYVA
ncbi:hypothetical protein CPB83DRAFT_858912 [Crepidotus variabilis]|uniref:Uncharacterized protein n=1 Tax=Crepidotus variabilis TaxID=179855 RepID=A0A9P6EB73_9AGAR|nr:hypothetical protein CPB83DRAFT_858912 [Crepidotus variabilis]